MNNGKFTTTGFQEPGGPLSIRNVKVQERLLRELQLTLKKTKEICHASESTAAQLKEVSEGDTVSAVNFSRNLGVHVARKKTPASQQRNVEIVGEYTSQIIALLAVNHAATVVNLTILQPFVEVESPRHKKQHKH